MTVLGLGPLGFELGMEHLHHGVVGRILREIDVLVVSPAVGRVARMVVELDSPKLSGVPLRLKERWHMIGPRRVSGRTSPGWDRCQGPHTEFASRHSTANASAARKRPCSQMPQRPIWRESRVDGKQREKGAGAAAPKNPNFF